MSNVRRIATNVRTYYNIYVYKCMYIFQICMLNAYTSFIKLYLQRREVEFRLLQEQINFIFYRTFSRRYRTDTYILTRFRYLIRYSKFSFFTSFVSTTIIGHSNVRSWTRKKKKRLVEKKLPAFHARLIFLCLDSTTNKNTNWRRPLVVFCVHIL